MVVTPVRAGLGLLFGLAACGSGGGFPDARPIDSPIPGGRFAVSWTVTDNGGQPISCDPIGAQSITAAIHNRAVEGGETEVFVCSTGSGESQAFTPGIYDMDFQLNGAIVLPAIPDGVIARAAPQLGVLLESGKTTQLAPLAFKLDVTGGLALHFDAGKAAGNCAATGANGAGITTTSISLVKNRDSSCAAVTLDIAAGATQPARTYTIDCATPVDGPCIDSDQVITVMGVPSDSYTIHIKGKTVPTMCWTNNDALQVPPNGVTLTHTLNLALTTGTPGC
jgi:hypothetical protein